MPSFADKRTLIGLAWMNVVLHVLALILAFIGIRPGSPLVALPERLSYLASDPVGWSLGWAIWMVSALLLVAYFAALTRHLPDQRPLPQLAVIVAAAGAAVDLICNAIYFTALPLLAAKTPPAEATFLAFERAANALGLIVANGLYSVGTLLLTMCMRQRPRWGRWATLVGYAVFGFGMILVIAGFLNEPRLAALGTGPTIVFYCLWTILVARSMNAKGIQP